MSNRIKIVLLIAVIGLVASATSAQAQSTSMQLGCTGQLIEPTAKTPSPKVLQLTISSGKVGLDFGSGSAAAKVQSDNKIQLKFSTDEFTGDSPDLQTGLNPQVRPNWKEQPPRYRSE